jgi:uncharacterized protein
VRFEWDPEKDKTNRGKHKVSFSEACYIFSDPSMLTTFDEEHSDDEDRWVTIGQTTEGKVLVVNHTYRKTDEVEYVRIISVRKATKHEARQYLERRIQT